MTTAIHHTSHPAPEHRPSYAVNDPHLAILGGGITGLVAANEALKRGEKHITVYEAENRLGGKIQSGMIGNSIINRGAEFIDSDHAHLIALAKELGVNLVENKGMEKEIFQHRDGRPMSEDEFYSAYKPYAEHVIADREEATRNPNGPRARYLANLSLEQYVAELQQTVKPVSRGFWQALTDTVLLRGNDNAHIAEIAANSYASEAGRPIGQIGALQFLNETSSDAETMLSSNCKFRVEGGTEQLIVKLREKLEAQGVKFVTGAKVKSAVKTAQGGIDLTFDNPAHNTHVGKTIFALPSYAFNDIGGLETLGFTPEMQSQIAGLQYTNSFKLTVAFKPGMATPDHAFYSTKGYQCWNPSPGLLTFLSNADEIGAKSPKQVIMERLEDYAKAHGSTADAMFDLGQLDFNNPGQKACYATPAPGQAKTLEALQSHMPALAAHGVGLAGTYIPLEGNFGFMECGLVSAKQAVARIVSPEQSAGHEQQKQWAHHVVQQRAAAANEPSGALRT